MGILTGIFASSVLFLLTQQLVTDCFTSLSLHAIDMDICFVQLNPNITSDLIVLT